MTRDLDYLAHLASESRRFRDVLAGCDPEARVPACPGWAAADLLWHLVRVQGFWAGCLTRRPEPPADGDEPDDAERPAAYAELLAAFDRSHERLRAAFVGAEPAEEAWTWSSDHTVAFIRRRQAHEALIHRLDAEQAAGVVGALPAELAADGVREVLEVMYGGAPPWGTFEALHHVVRVDCSDTDDQVWVRLGVFAGTDPASGTTYEDEPDLRLIEHPDQEPDVVVEAPAGVLDAWLWRRTDDTGVHVAGDREVFDRFRASVDHPIN